MKIALLTDGIYPYVMGGIQKHSYYLVKFFAKNKVYVDLYHMPQNKEFDIQELAIFTEDEKKYIRSIVLDFPVLNKFPGHYLKESYLYSERIYRILKNNLDVDFIYCQGFTGWKLIQEKKASSFKMPPIGVHFHGLEMFQKLPSLRATLGFFILQRPVLFNILNANFVFSLGGKLTDILKAKGVVEKKIIQVPLGIDEDWLNPDITGKMSIPTFVFIGRYERRKGIQELNEALNVLLAKGGEFKFHFIGPIPEKYRIISSKIQYWGSISDSIKIKNILSKCDVLVCPSHSEGMPNVILEAMSAGLSVIATDVGAISCLVNNTNGWIIQPHNQEQLIHSIEDVIQMDGNKLMQKKKLCQELIKEKYLLDDIIKKTIEEIEIRINK